MMRYVILTVCLTAAALLPMAAMSAEQESASDSVSQGSAVETTRHDLWRASVRAPDDEQGPGELKKSISRLKAIRLPKGLRGASPSGSATTQPASGAASQPVTLPASQPARIDPETFGKLKKLGLRGVVPPAVIADVLLRAGHSGAAAELYEIALRGEKDPEEKAWLLYRLANSRQQSDPKAAVEIYTRLLSEHPESLWSSVAEAHKSVIEWRDTSGLASLLRQTGPARRE